MAADILKKPEECVMLLVDFQAGLGFGVESIPRQVVINNAVALARTAVAFKVPVIERAGDFASRNEICFGANGFSPLKAGGHQREIDDRPKHCQAIRTTQPGKLD